MIWYDITCCIVSYVIWYDTTCYVIVYDIYIYIYIVNYNITCSIIPYYIRNYTTCNIIPYHVINYNCSRLSLAGARFPAHKGSHRTPLPGDSYYIYIYIYIYVMSRYVERFWSTMAVFCIAPSGIHVIKIHALRSFSSMLIWSFPFTVYLSLSIIIHIYIYIYAYIYIHIYIYTYIYIYIYIYVCVLRSFSSQLSRAAGARAAPRVTNTTTTTIIIIITTTTTMIIVINCNNADNNNNGPLPRPAGRPARSAVRPVHLLSVFLLRVLESNFPGDSLYNYTKMRIPTL